MIFPTITNENFNTIPNFVSYFPIYSSNELKFYRQNDDIIIETSFLCCPCIYWKKEGNIWAVSFLAENIEKWCEDNNIPLTERTDFSEFGEMWEHFKEEAKRSYKYLGINYIEGWKKVILHSDGTFEKENYSLNLFSLDLKENYDLYKKWILKYRKIVRKLNEEGLFIPFFNGELDARIFSCLYRDLEISTNLWYLKPIKTDNAETYAKKIEKAEEILSLLNFSNLQHVDDLKVSENIYVTTAIHFTGNMSTLANPNDPRWIYKNVQHSYDKKDTIMNFLIPYIDDIWVSFYQTHALSRCLNAFVLCPDLIETTLYSSPSGEYTFKSKFHRVIKEAKEIIEYWGENKIKNILIEE